MMTTMNSKLVEKISSIHNQIEMLQATLTSNLPISDKVDRTNKLNLGSMMLELYGLGLQFLTTVELFVENGGDLQDIPKEPLEYYNAVQELKKPISDTDTEEIKNIKNYINNYKNGV